MINQETSFEESTSWTPNWTDLCTSRTNSFFASWITLPIWTFDLRHPQLNWLCPVIKDTHIIVFKKL